MVRTESDESKKIVEQTKTEDEEGNLLTLEQKVTYINTSGDSREYSSVGEGGVIEVMMPDSQKIDVEYAKDSLEGINFERVIVGVESDTGVLVIPEESVPLIVDYGFCVSVTNNDMKVILYEEVVSGLSASEGDIELSIEPADSSNMNDVQMRVVGENYAVSILLKVNGDNVTQLDGDAEVSLMPGLSAVAVYRVNDNGSREFIESFYNQETGKLTFLVQHFSIYMVEAKAGDSGNMLLYVVIGSVLLIIALAAVVVVKRRDRC